MDLARRHLQGEPRELHLEGREVPVELLLQDSQKGTEPRLQGTRRLDKVGGEVAMVELASHAWMPSGTTAGGKELASFSTMGFATCAGCRCRQKHFC